MFRPIICLLTVLLNLLFSATAFSQEKLLFSLDLIRHGDRAFLFQLPKSPLNCKEGLGELTDEGKTQERQLGAALRSRYIDQARLLPTFYDPSTLFVRATDAKRATDSADAFLQGLYPPRYRAKQDVIVVHTVKKSADNLLIAKPSGNIFALIKRYLKARQYWREQTKNLQAQLKNWGDVTGVPLDDFQQLDKLADNLYVRRSHHQPMPAGISGLEAEQIIRVMESAIIELFQDPSVTRPMGHEFLTTVARYLHLASQQKTPLKYVLLSGHDSSILAVMNTLQAPLNHLPLYAARINFSLFEKDNNYYLAITFNDKPVNMPACNGFVCTLAQFDALAKNS